MKLKVGDRILIVTGSSEIRFLLENRVYRVESIEAGAGNNCYRIISNRDGWFYFISRIDRLIDAGNIEVVSYGEDKKFL